MWGAAAETVNTVVAQYFEVVRVWCGKWNQSYYLLLREKNLDLLLLSFL